MGKIITFGELLLRLTTPGNQRFGQAASYAANFGGGEANVAVSLANYGKDAKFVTRLPENDIADAAIKEMRGLGVDTSAILRGGERMGIYFLETGAVSRPSKIIYDRADSAICQVTPKMFDWDQIFEGAEWFHWTGITPAISKGAAETCLEAIKVANAKGITVSTDMNYRKNLWKYGKTPLEVMPEMVNGCDVILGNEEDAAMTLGIKPESLDLHSGKISGEDYLPVSQEIMKRFPKCKLVITTLRGSVSANHNSWSGVLYNGKKLYQAPTYQITNIVDRVGGGDSFMGGLIYGLLTYASDFQKALNFAVAASCLKHTIPGDFNRVSVVEVEKLMSGDASGRVIR